MRATDQAYVAGFFDGEGSVTFEPYSTVKKEQLRIARQLALMTGIPGRATNGVGLDERLALVAQIDSLKVTG